MMEAAFDAMKASLQTAIRTKKLASNPGNAVSAFMNEWKLYEGIFKFEKYASYVNKLLIKVVYLSIILVVSHLTFLRLFTLPISFSYCR